MNDVDESSSLVEVRRIHGVLIDLLSAELDRYWTRFNIFAALHLAAVIAFATTSPSLQGNWGLACFFLLGLVALSGVGLIAMLRSSDLQRGIVDTIALIEGKLPPGEQVIQLCRAQLRMPMYSTNLACNVFAMLCLMGWLVALCAQAISLLW